MYFAVNVFCCNSGDVFVMFWCWIEVLNSAFFRVFEKVFCTTIFYIFYNTISYNFLQKFFTFLQNILYVFNAICKPFFVKIIVCTLYVYK